MSAFGQASLRWSPGSITQPNSPSGLCPAKSEILTILSSQAPLRHTWQGRFFLVSMPSPGLCVKRSNRARRPRPVPELGEEAEQERRQKNGKDDGDRLAPPFAERRDEPGQSAGGDVQARQVRDHDERGFGLEGHRRQMNCELLSGLRYATPLASRCPATDSLPSAVRSPRRPQRPAAGADRWVAWAAVRRAWRRPAWS